MRDTDLLLRRLAVIQLIVNELTDTGKIKIQKILYFIQEALGAPLEYRFRMHHYGPFSEDIESDISVMRSVGHIEVNVDAQGYGYHITPASDEMLPWDSEIGKHREEILKAIAALGALDASRLELFATVHFVQQLQDKPSKKMVLDTVSRLKPKFDMQIIEFAYDQLVRNKLIVEAPSA